MVGREHDADVRSDLDFTGLHPLEVQAIADGEVAGGMTGYDPTTNGQLTKEELKRAKPIRRPS